MRRFGFHLRRFCSSASVENHKGKRVCVTGGSNGIGRGIAEKFAENGAIVTVGDIKIAENESKENIKHG